MAKFNKSEKLQQMLALMYALQRTKVAEALAKHGFSQQDLDKGWALFRVAVGDKFHGTSEVPTGTDHLALLDAWENKWYPIIDATLEANFPDVHATVMMNMSQVEGTALIPSVEILLDRVAGLADEEASENEKKASELLVKRGVTTDVLGEARLLIGALTTIDAGVRTPEALENEAMAEEAQEDALKAMWTYYKEWSAIVRVAIKNKKILKSLGFLQDSSKSKSKKSSES